MIELPLTTGEVTLIDNEDFELLNQYHWRLHKGYVETGRYPNVIYMHRLLVNGQGVDHIDGNKLNNQRTNLRIADRGTNRQNSKLNANDVSGYKGVYYYAKTNKWKAKITVDKASIHLGYFTNILDAVNAYDTAARRYYGEHAKTNL